MTSLSLTLGFSLSVVFSSVLIGDAAYILGVHRFVWMYSRPNEPVCGDPMSDTERELLNWSYGEVAARWL
jgi:hypothetical protein